MTKLTFLVAALVLSGCNTLGYSAEQFKAMQNGAVICNYARTLQGSLGGTAVNAQELGRNLTAETEITVNPEQGCATHIRGKAIAPKPVPTTH